MEILAPSATKRLAVRLDTGLLGAGRAKQMLENNNMGFVTTWTAEQLSTLEAGPDFSRNITHSTQYEAH